MHNEAEDYIDNVSDGRQDIWADAIRHSMRGTYSELYDIRKKQIASLVQRNKSEGTGAEGKVKISDISGTGALRGVKLRLYLPNTASHAKLPLLVYFHGGGWSTGSIETGYSYCKGVAESGKAAVLAIDYSPSPEHRYPDALNECVSAIEFAMANASKWGCTPEEISVGGDESGGNLALATALYLEKDPSINGKIKSVVAINPITKCFRDHLSPSWKKYSRGYGLDARLLEAYISAYTGIDSDSHDSLLSPSYATEQQLKNLPPLLIINSGRSILADQTEAFVSSASKAGCKVRHITFPQAVDGFIAYPGQPTALKKAIEFTIAFLSS